jgi:hypothetical protein
MVKLTNETNQAVIVLLDHPTFHRGAWGFEQRAIQVYDKRRNGTVAPRTVRRVHPGALRVPPRTSTCDLPDEVLQVEAVAAFVRSGKLSVQSVPTRAASVTAPSTVLPPRHARGGKLSGGKDEG